MPVVSPHPSINACIIPTTHRPPPAPILPSIHTHIRTVASGCSGRGRRGACARSAGSGSRAPRASAAPAARSVWLVGWLFVWLIGSLFRGELGCWGQPGANDYRDVQTNIHAQPPLPRSVRTTHRDLRLGVEAVQEVAAEDERVFGRVHRVDPPGRDQQRLACGIGGSI